MIGAPQAATIDKVYVSEGELVSKGQALLRLRIERTTSAGDVAELNARAIQQRRIGLETERTLALQQRRQRVDALKERLRSLAAEERQAEAELDTLRLRAMLSAKSYERSAQLERERFISDAQLQQKQEDLLDVQLRQRAAERSVVALKRDAEAVEADLLANETNTRTTLSQLNRAIFVLDQELAENSVRSIIVIAAPKDGKVGPLNFGQGSTVQAGQAILQMTLGTSRDEKVLEAQLYGPSRAVGFISTGQTVWMRYGAYPHQKFGLAKGTVAKVSETPIAAADLPVGQASALLSAAQVNEPLYRVTVSLEKQHVDAYGQRKPLKPGMTLNADVAQDERRIWEWILEPLLAHSPIFQSMKGK